MLQGSPHSSLWSIILSSLGMAAEWWVQFSRLVVSHSFEPHGLQQARLPCLSPTPRACSDSYPWSWWRHLILCRPILLLPSVFPRIRLFSSESVFHIRWPKYWSFSFNLSPSSEYSGLISFRIGWLDLPAVQGILKNLSNTTVHKHQFFSA